MDQGRRGRTTDGARRAPSDRARDRWRPVADEPEEERWGSRAPRSRRDGWARGPAARPSRPSRRDRRD